MAVSLRRIAALFGPLLVLLPASLASQVPITVSGRVVRVSGADTLPVAGAPVTLHRVGRTEQGAVDSAATGADGGFRFRRMGDTTAVYLVSARFAGIEYFGDPLRPPGRDALLIPVSDTSSTVPIRLAARHVIVRAPDVSGTRVVVDLLSIRNDGRETRVGRDSLAPSWEIALPVGAFQAEVQEGDVSPTAVQFLGDTLRVLAPLAPGQKNIMVTYRLPMDADRPSWIAPDDSLDVMVEEPRATVTGAGLRAVAPVDVLGTALRRWTATPPAGGPALVRFGSASATVRGALPWLVGAVALVILAAAVIVLRRTAATTKPGAPLPATDLIGLLARLDAEYAGRHGDVDTAEWSAYQTERSRLKAAALARGRPRR